MSQVIAFETENGNVAICIPTGEISIEAVLEKDCPSHAFITFRIVALLFMRLKDWPQKL